MKATLFDIERNSFVDGPGIRTTVFFKGCNLKCAWCHNPESQSPRPQMLFYRDKCIACGKCAQICKSPDNCTLCGRCTLFCPADARKVCGKEYTADEILTEVLKDKAYYENSDGGITCSGGECMLQPDLLAELLKRCKEAGIHTAVDTAGHVPFSHFEKVLPYTDLFLYDIKHMDTAKHKEYVGVGNERILENLQKLMESAATIWIRIPVIPGFNDSIEHMQQVKSFLDRSGKTEKVELLPYHAMGKSKYAALGQTTHRFSEPDKGQLLQLKEIFA